MITSYYCFQDRNEYKKYGRYLIESQRGPCVLRVDEDFPAERVNGEDGSVKRVPVLSFAVDEEGCNPSLLVACLSPAQVGRLHDQLTNWLNARVKDFQAEADAMVRERMKLSVAEEELDAVLVANDGAPVTEGC